MVLGIVDALPDRLMQLFIDTTVGALRRVKPLTILTAPVYLNQLRMRFESIANDNHPHNKLIAYECLLRLALITGSISDIIRLAERLQRINDDYSLTISDHLCSCLDASSIDQAIDGLWQRSMIVNLPLIEVERSVIPIEDGMVKLIVKFKLTDANNRESAPFIPIRIKMSNGLSPSSIDITDPPNMQIINKSNQLLQIDQSNGHQSMTSLCIVFTLPRAQISIIRLTFEGYICRFSSIGYDLYNNDTIRKIFDRLLMVAVQLQRVSIQIQLIVDNKTNIDDIEYLKLCWQSTTTIVSKSLILELIIGTIHAVIIVLFIFNHYFSAIISMKNMQNQC